MKKNKKQLNRVEKIFDNNKFNNVDFEIFVNKTKSFAFIKNDIDKVLNDKNCTEENLALIKAYKNAFKARLDISTKYISLYAFCISILSLINNLGPDKKYYDCMDFTFSNFIALSIVVFSILIMIRGYKRSEEKLEFSYSYLLNKMEIKIKNLDKRLG